MRVGVGVDGAIGWCLGLRNERTWEEGRGG